MADVIPVNQQQEMDTIKAEDASSDLGGFRTRRPSVHDSPDKPWKDRIHIFFEHPKSSRWAYLFHIFMLVIILLATLTFLIGSFPTYESTHSTGIFAVELICTIIFTVEYVVLISTAPKPHLFALRPLSVINFLALLPFWIEIGIHKTDIASLGAIRVVRLFRVFRIFKFGRYSKNTRLLSETFRRSLDAFGLLVFILIMGVILFSSALFYAEQIGETYSHDDRVWIRDIDDTKSPFQSIPETFWWCVITLTTVGYGDVVPVTWLGKIVACLTALSGILVFAFPITILGATFNDVYSEYKAYKEQKRRQ